MFPPNVCIVVCVFIFRFIWWHYTIDFDYVEIKFDIVNKKLQKNQYR